MPRPRKTGKPKHPLQQWRERYNVSQQVVANVCDVTQVMVSMIEGYLRFPQIKVLDILMDYTGLAAEAFVRPERFMLAHPDFLDQTHPPQRPLSEGDHP